MCAWGMKDARLKQMEQFIIERDFVTIEELCDKFQIHYNTARSDIKKLAEKGVAEKKYGGVANITQALPVSFNERKQKNASAKETIGERAMGLLEEEDVIFVDSGTTVLNLFRKPVSLPKHVTVITNNIDVVFLVTRYTNFTIFVLPGKVERKLNALASLETIDSLEAYNIQKAFIGTRGISPTGELFSSSNVDAKIKNVAIKTSKSVILMADSNKMSQSEIFRFAKLEDIDFWICENATPEIYALADKNNVKLI